MQLHLLKQFWWPHITADMKWFVSSCHVCQTQCHRHTKIPPTVAIPGPLFGYVYIDMVHMPKSSGYQYVVHARSSLTVYPKAQMLCVETAAALTDFIFQDLLCQWGRLYKMIADNGTPIRKMSNYFLLLLITSCHFLCIFL